MAKFCPKTGKLIFYSELDTNLAIVRIQFLRKKHRTKSFYRDEPIRSYQCEFCHHWHMTGQKKRGQGVG